MKVKLLYTPMYQRFQPQPPLGITTLTAALRRLGIAVEQVDLELEYYLYNMKAQSRERVQDERILGNYQRAIDYMVNTKPDPLLEESLKKLMKLADIGDCDVVGFSVMSLRQFITAILIAREIRRQGTRSVVVLGGEFVRSNAEKILRQFDFVDYVFVGHAYNHLPILLNDISGKAGKLQTLPSRTPITCNKKITAETTGKADIEDMPPPDMQGLLLDRYVDVMKGVFGLECEVPVIKYITSTGCPFHCTFCNRPARDIWSIKSPVKVVKELAELSQTYKTNLFSLECELINASATWMEALSNELNDHRTNLEWYAYARPARLPAKSLFKLYSAGCRILRFGVESGSQRILKLMNKGTTVEEMEKVLRDSSACGIWNHINLIVGFPGESSADLQATIDFINRNSNNIDSIKINPFYINNESAIRAEPEKYGISIREYKRDNIEYYTTCGATWDEICSRNAEAITKIGKVMKQTGIGQAGAIIELLFAALTKFHDKEKCKQWLRENHGYMFECLPVQELLKYLYYVERVEERHSEEWIPYIGRWGGSYDVLEF